MKRPRHAVPAAGIFKAYDIRGTLGSQLSAAAVRAIAQALGSEAQARGQHTIAVGRDGRLSGPELGAALIEGLLAAGMDVIDIGCVPTPVTYFAAHELGCASCVSLTGSHNPPQYNGLKMVLGGQTLHGGLIQDLRRRIADDDLRSGQGSLRQADVSAAYLARIVDDVKLARPMKIVIDCGNGVAGPIALALFRRLGCEVSGLYCDIDGRFPHHHPDPSRPENLQDLIRAVREQGAELGLAFDGDGDRLGVVTRNGEIIHPDRQLMLFAADVLSRVPGAEILYDVKCSRKLAPWIHAHGGRPTMWKTGHALMKAKLQETGAALGGEMSGHLFFQERWYGFDDGLYAGARLLEILAAHPEPAALLQALPDAPCTPELNLKMGEGEPLALVQRLQRRARFEGAQEVITLDGIRVDYADGFGLARPSNTTPVLVLRFEGDDDAALSRIQAAFRAAIDAVWPGLQLPF